jgi:hypothetical protein
MGGGLMQLVAYGAQDVYLSGNPQITFFKVVYRRHTNFSVEPIQQTWNGAGDFGRTVTCNINRNGDLITNMYVVVKLPFVAKPALTSTPVWGYVNRLGHAIIDSVKIEIGGSKIDEQYGDWLNIWYELTHKAGQERGYAKMIGDIPELTNITLLEKPAYTLYIPLQFWFNRNNGLALPLIALQYHDVRVTLSFRTFNDCVNYTQDIAPSNLSMVDSYLLIDYIYLDSEERKRFAQASHEYLIEQLQFTGSESWSATNTKLLLNFNHPSKYLVWAPHLSIHNKRNKWLSYSTTNPNNITNFISNTNMWNIARDRFAVMLSVIFAEGFELKDENTDKEQIRVSVTHNIYNAGTNPTGTLKITGTPGNWAVTGLANFNPAAGIPTLIKNLLDNKIKLQFITSDYIDTGNARVTDKLASAGNSTSIFFNCIVTKNELTIEDMTHTIDELKTYLPASSIKVNDLVDLWTYNIINYHNYGLYIDGSANPCTKAKLQLNGHDRFQERDGNYFNYVQPAQHFTTTPADGINVYSFALKAEDHQPSGSCNFSRIDNATLNVTTDKIIPSGSILNIYTQNYNVLRVMSGMAGTAYSN